MKLAMLLVIFPTILPYDCSGGGGFVPPPQPDMFTGQDDAGALSMAPPDLLQPEDSYTAVGTCQIPSMACGEGGTTCAANQACTPSGQCLQLCVDAMQCPMAVTSSPCPYPLTVFGCFKPCYATDCAGGCPSS